MLRGRNIRRHSFARVPDGSWRGEMRDTRGSGGENGVYCSSYILLSKPFMEVVPTNEAGWMNTDPIVSTHGRPHGNSQIWLREKVVRRSCVMAQVEAAMQVSDWPAFYPYTWWLRPGMPRWLRKPRLIIVLNSQIHWNWHVLCNIFKALNSFS